MIRYFKSKNADSIFKIQGEGAFIYSKLTHTFERCNLYDEILFQKDEFMEIDEIEVRRFIHNIQGIDKALLRDNMMLHKAIAFACIAHEGQVRKGTKIPYIVHPFEVAQILSEAGADEEVICAGLLHDIIEDTNYTGEDLEALFGQRVRMLVESCTQECEGSWEERKQHYIEYLEKEATLDGMMISCADKLANIRSTKENYEKEKENVWKRFNRGKSAHSWYFSKLIDAFLPLQNYDMFWELNTIYKELFVSHYRKNDKLYQTNGIETYVYEKGKSDWILTFEKNTFSAEEGFQKIDDMTTRQIISKWELKEEES